jgi:hypothetical protein
LKRFLLAGLVCACAAIFGCGGANQSPSADANSHAQPAAPAVPDDIDAAAKGTLGSDAEALAWGDLALNGHQQVLVVNRLNGADPAAQAGAVITRLAIVENDDGHWTEILVCDEHLKNSKGYLGGASAAEVSSWHLQYVRNPKQGLQLFLSPFRQGSGVRQQTIEVRWNPEVSRYQAMDDSHEHFMGESMREPGPVRRTLDYE